MPTYCIVGGVAAGASTAARLRRLDEKAEILLFERGEHVSYATCGLPYYIGGSIRERDRLFVMTPERLRERLAVDVRVKSEVTSIDRTAKTITVRDLGSGRDYTQAWDRLVLAPGAEPLRPDIPGIGSEGIFTLRTTEDADAIRTWMETRTVERAVVVGGGYVGLEMAENLHARGAFVTIVEAMDQVMNVLDSEMAALVQRHLRDNSVELYLGDGVTRFERLAGKTVAHLSSGEKLAADIVILSIGVKPESRLAAACGLALTPRGAILVDRELRTDDPGIFALGDVAAFPHPILGQAMPVPLAGPASKQARVVAGNIVAPGSETWTGAIGTAIAKIFGMTVATTGVPEKVLKAAGIPCASVITHGSDHAGYYPDAKSLVIKTIFDPSTGRVLGAQVAGTGGVDKRIDLMAAIVKLGGTVRDLATLEHAYSPPFSSSRDPVNIAGSAALNIVEGLASVVSWKEIAELREEGAFLLDVRTPEEFELGALADAVNVPLDELRMRLGSIPRDRMIVCYCRAGHRGYLAERILRQNGWTEVRNLSGGYLVWHAATEPQSLTGLYVPGMDARGQTIREPAKDILPGDGIEGQAGPAGDPGILVGESVSILGKRVLVDACGLQCPGPILRLKAEMDKADEGTRIEIRATDPGFARDVAAWAGLTKNRLVDLVEAGGVHTATVEKTQAQMRMLETLTASRSATRDHGPVLREDLTGAASLIMFSDDMDRALAGFVLANGAAASGKRVTMFFTFWGLSVIKKRSKPRVRKDFMGRMFGMMLPSGPGSLGLSKMQFAGMGPLMMKYRMKSRKVDMIETMIAQALAAGVSLVACQMSMDIMGVAREELLEEVQIGGVATYMEEASRGTINLFI